jgi:hypothetical protein
MTPMCLASDGSLACMSPSVDPPTALEACNAAAPMSQPVLHMHHLLLASVPLANDSGSPSKDYQVSAYRRFLQPFVQSFLAYLVSGPSTSDSKIAKEWKDGVGSRPDVKNWADSPVLRFEARRCGCHRPSRSSFRRIVTTPCGMRTTPPCAPHLSCHNTEANSS